MTEITYYENEDFYEPTKWNILCMETCLNSAKLSKCSAKHVSAIIADNDSIYSIGVNGTMPESVNCNEIFKKIEGKWYDNFDGDWKLCERQDSHHRWSLKNEIHAEVNAISKMARKGISTEGLDLYCTHSPCYNCAKTIMASGIKRVFYTNKYDDLNDEMIKAFNKSGIELIEITKEQIEGELFG